MVKIKVWLQKFKKFIWNLTEVLFTKTFQFRTGLEMISTRNSSLESLVERSTDQKSGKRNLSLQGLDFNN